VAQVIYPEVVKMSILEGRLRGECLVSKLIFG
jgi:hypothetical protein